MPKAKLKAIPNEPAEMGRLQDLVSRIDGLEDEKAAIQAELKDVYAEAKNEGFMIKVLRTVVRRRRRDRNKVAEEDQAVQLYEEMLG